MVERVAGNFAGKNFSFLEQRLSELADSPREEEIKYSLEAESTQSSLKETRFSCDCYFLKQTDEDFTCLK